VYVCWHAIGASKAAASTAAHTPHMALLQMTLLSLSTGISRIFSSRYADVGEEMKGREEGVGEGGKER
jgi:hypothetical protein